GQCLFANPAGTRLVERHGVPTPSQTQLGSWRVHWSRIAWAGEVAFLGFALPDPAALEQDVARFKAQLAEFKGPQARQADVKLAVVEQELALTRRRLADGLASAADLSDSLGLMVDAQQADADIEVMGERALEYVERNLRLVGFNAYLWERLRSVEGES